MQKAIGGEAVRGMKVFNINPWKRGDNKIKLMVSSTVSHAC
jgi:hypothetical protein